MAASMTNDFSMPLAHIASYPSHVGANRRRRTSPQAGRALEILGHAVEYLTDEFVHRGGEVCSSNGELEAVQMLMALNRQVYFECPVMPTIAERLRAVFHLHAA